MIQEELKGSVRTGVEKENSRYFERERDSDRPNVTVTMVQMRDGRSYSFQTADLT